MKKEEKSVDKVKKSATRFKRSKKRGLNRRGSVRLLKIHGPKIDLMKADDDLNTSIEQVLNKERRLSPSVLQYSLDSSESSSKIMKLQRNPKRVVIQKAILREFYGKLDRTKRDNRVKKKQKRNDIEESLLSSREMRVDVIRFRSGLVTSRAIAKQLIKDGKVIMQQQESPEKELVKQKVRYQSQKIDKVGCVRSREEKTYEKLVPLLDKYQKVPENKLEIPPYRITDQEQGIVAVLRKPRDGEVILPKSVSLACRKD